MPEKVNGNIEFSADEAIPGCCPICQSYELEYDDSEVIDDGILNKITCNSCGMQGRQYDKTVFDGYEISYIPEGYTVPIVQRIAIIESGYVRDTQVFTADPAIVETDTDWEDHFKDVKNFAHFVGIFEGTDDEDIRNRAAAFEGVHPGVISLIDIETGTVTKSDG